MIVEHERGKATSYTCPRCLKNLAPAINILGDASLVNLLHSAAHLRQDRAQLVQVLRLLVERHDEEPSMLTAEEWGKARALLLELGELL